MESHGQAVCFVDVALQRGDTSARCNFQELTEECSENRSAAVLGMGVESCDEPLPGLARLEHGVSDKCALTADSCDFGNWKRSLDRDAQAIRIKLITRAFSVFAQRQ